MIDRNGASLRRQVRTHALGTSAIILAAMFAGPVFAQCAPEPTVVNGTTTCRGTDPDGLRVTTFGARVAVESSATVRGAGAPAIGVQIASGDGFGAVVVLSVAGTVDGGTDAGVSLTAQPIPNNFFNQSLALTVAAGGLVTGANAVVVGRAPTQNFITGRVDIDNSGAMVGTGGVALLSTDTANAGFSSIINRASGTIGAIVGPVGSLANAGTINGGSRSAIDWSGSSTSFFGDLVNTGVISSTSTAATLSNVPNFRVLTNSGLIENTGAGAAIANAGSINVSNAGTGRIASAGPIGISVSETLVLTNAGTIVGDVVTGGTSPFSGSTVDSTGGRIAGSLRLGAAADTLIATYDGTRLQYGISGVIDGGAGIDLVRARFASDATIAAPLALPTAFERLAFVPDAGITATLATGFVAPGTLLVGGAGTLVNRGALTGAGQILVGEIGGTASVVNAGSITSTLNIADDFAIRLAGFNRFENSGTITATRDAVSLFGSGSIVNSGTITAGGTSLSVFSSGFSNAATGVIRSTGGVGLVLSSSSLGTGPLNAGRIEGMTAGVRLSSTLTNTGTITASQAGIVLDFNATLDNRAGGLVSGSGAAITAKSLGSTFFSFGNTVANAGIISGNVALGDDQQLTVSNSRFFALPGGVLNGDLALGHGDLLVTELVNTGTGAFAGINGSVAATNAQLRLRVRQDASGEIATPAGFVSVGYELLNGATLTLTGTASTGPLLLAGNGHVDVTADIATSTGPAIQSTFVSIAPGETDTTNALTITSRGALTLTRSGNTTFPGAVVALGGDHDFTNMGTIVATDLVTPSFNQFAAIRGGFAATATGGNVVTNNGTITLDGTIGIMDARAITNRGSIVQAAGGRAATGIIAGNGNGGTLTNTGTIDVAGVAALSDFGRLTIDNSGLIASSGDAAIASSNGFDLAINNLAGGTIATSANGPAIRTSGGTLINAGTIIGTVDIGFATVGRSFIPGTYVADGGTIAGNVLFGLGEDVLVSFGSLGVSGRIDGGGGVDTLIQARRTNDIVALGLAGVSNFERQGVRTLGADTLVTLRADGLSEGPLSLSGDGGIVNTATIAGTVFVDNPSTFANGTFQPGPLLASVTNQGEIRGGFNGEARLFANTGIVGSARLDGTAVSIISSNALAFSNTGVILNSGSEAAVSLEIDRGGEIVASNTGTITGGLEAYMSNYAGQGAAETMRPSPLSFTNGGTVTGGGIGGRTVQLFAELDPMAGGAVTLANTGTIEALEPAGVAAELATFGARGIPDNRVMVTNAGTIRANGAGFKSVPAALFPGASIPFAITNFAAALVVFTEPNGRSEVTNEATGTIEATGSLSVALSVGSGALDLANAGIIGGGTGTVLTDDDRLGDIVGRPYLAGAVQTRGADDRIVNTGSIIGSIDVGAGADRIDNLGRIRGDVFLGSGDDTFLQRASAILIGTVDAGAGDDLLVVDATGGGVVDGDQFANFDRFNQIGEGSVVYSGNFRFDTLGVTGGTVTVAAGQILSSAGSVTITGSDAAESVVNDGTIASGISLTGGDDRVLNRGTIGGLLQLGDGDDGFVEGRDSRVAGGVDGGAGIDTYTAFLAGDRTGLGARSGFERLVVEGAGTLGLTLDQGFAAVSLVGTGLSAALNGFAIGDVTGSDVVERLAVDGDIASVSLGAGGDLLALGTSHAGGRYDGGAGIDELRFTATGPVTLAGSATGFEQVALTGNALTVTGALGGAGASLALGDRAQALTVASGGMLAGVVDLGAGDDAFRLAAGGTLAGVVIGGTGADTTTIELSGDRALAGTSLAGFETLASEGRGTLTLTGTHAYDNLLAATDLSIDGSASLEARQVRFAVGNQHFMAAGRFTGAVDGGIGTDTVTVSGGTAVAPAAFTEIASIEAFAMTGGYATITGSATLGAADLSAGRLVGLAGSTITATQIVVRPGATFGSAGTVNGNLTVAGTLSPGASPGLMSVNGTVALASGSVSIFELTPTAQDKLVINGTLSIASGATLQLSPIGMLRPGASFDLITASAGITGSFSTVLKPDSLIGFVIQRADRIQLIGQFLSNSSLSPQIARSVAYANTLLITLPASSPLFAALPALVSADGGSDPRAFAQLTPEPYASATQIGVENALALTDATRGPAFAADRTEPGAFTFAQGVGSWFRLSADPAEGVNPARTNSHGFLGGIGYGNRGWTVGAFGGYLDGKQRIDALGASTAADGWVAGVHGRFAANRVGLGASIIYNATQASTQRVLPGGGGTRGSYGIDSWVADASVNYTIDMVEWTLKPRAGLTYLRTRRERLVELGGPFALSVARDRHVAGFADAGIGFGRSETSEARFRPVVALGMRYQIEGRRAIALAGYAGGPIGLTALGVSRARAIGTASASVIYRLTPGLDLFSTVSAQTGRDDHREAVSTGLRLKF